MMGGPKKDQGPSGQAAQKARKPSPFAGHSRQGKRHVPPLLDLPVPMTPRPYRKVVFPDFLWLLTMLRLRPLAEGAGPTTKALDAGQAAFNRAHAAGVFGSEPVPVFRGWLSDWERVPEAERPRVLDELRALDIYEDVAPLSLAHALGAYVSAPGRWLVEPQMGDGFEPDVGAAEEHLWETIRLGGDSHQELAAQAIYLSLGMLAKNGRLHFAAHPAFDLVARYEDGLTDAERAMAESTMRAMFLSMAGLEDKAGAASVEWAEAFWRANRRLFACIWEPRDDPEPADENASGRASAHLYRLHYRFLKAADAIDPDVWDHDRYDVLTGVTWRILRIAAHLASHTALWSEEHGYPSVRMMFDGFVQLKWMLAVEGSRPGVWDEFKNYGRGRNKALLLQTEAAIERTDGEPREMLERLLPKLKDAANRDIREDFQDIHTTTTFTADDTSLLAMATDVGLQDMYHSLMIPASSTLHGDWAALDDQVLDRCLHPLHDRHAIPRAAYAEENLEQFPELAQRFAVWTFDEYCRAMGYEPMSNEDAEAEMLAQANES